LSYKNKLDRGLYTLFILCIYRLGSYITIPGLDLSVVSQFYNNNSSILGIFNSISGGSVSRMSVMSLNLMPYVSASIVMQLLTSIIPEWRELKKDSFQRRKINRYSRILALGIAFVQAVGILVGLENIPGLIIQSGIIFKITTVISIVAASLMVMWLSERISERGIGNGSSIIIFTGIICSIMPEGIGLIRDYVTGNCSNILFWSGFAFIFTLTSIVIFCESVRYLIRIFFKQSILRSTQEFVNLSSSYIPIKINPAGVLPVMFADSMMVIPAIIIRVLDNFIPLKQAVVTGLILLILKSLLILFFCIFCLSFTMNPDDIADNLRSRNACIPFVYEGERTSKFFEEILSRIAVIGCVYMLFISITPQIISTLLPITSRIMISGTSLLIMIGVSLDIYERMSPEPMENTQ